MSSSPKTYFHTPPREVNGFVIPAWWECQWRRTPCKKRTCTFCGRVRALGRVMGSDEEIEQDGNTDEAYDQLKETVRYQAKDLGLSEEQLLGGSEAADCDFEDDEESIDGSIDEDEPPQPGAFLWWQYAYRWTRPIISVVGKAHEEGASWAHTEEALDLLWYANVFPQKIYRQLSTHWEVRHAPKDERAALEEFVAVELIYTGYVLREIMAIIDNALVELSKRVDHPEPEQFAEALARFRRFQPHIYEITKHQ